VTGSQVSLCRLPNASGATAAMVDRLATQRVDKINRGVCVAECGGRSGEVEGPEAQVLLADGASDHR
jgi:hypothetical protein